MMPDFNEDLISAAIPSYLRFNAATSPCLNSDFLKNKYGEELANHLEAEISVIMGKLNSIAIDWNRHDLISASEFAVSEVVKEYPHLTKNAQDALMWKFTFDWR